MKKTFTLKTVMDFAAAHRLHGYDGDCARLHGHNWKVEVLVEGEKLNDIGMVIDFKEIKRHAKAVIAELDHTYLNDHPYFKARNPTAENLAVFLFDSLSERINTEQCKVKGITIWENERNCVTFGL